MSLLGEYLCPECEVAVMIDHYHLCMQKYTSGTSTATWAVRVLSLDLNIQENWKSLRRLGTGRGHSKVYLQMCSENSAQKLAHRTLSRIIGMSKYHSSFRRLELGNTQRQRRPVRNWVPSGKHVSFYLIEIIQAMYCSVLLV